MVENSTVQQDKEKRMKRYEDSLRDLWNNIKHTNNHIRGPRKKREKEHGTIFEEIIDENFPYMGKEIVSKVQEVQSPRQAKPKGEHTETHSNQADNNYRQR